jgi:hypothetical protein
LSLMKITPARTISSNSIALLFKSCHTTTMCKVTIRTITFCAHDRNTADAG